MWSHRKPRWEHWLLNTADEPIRKLDGVKGGSIQLQGLTRLGGHGTLELQHVEEIDWMRHRVQSVYDPGTGDPAWPVGTMMLSSPDEQRTQFGVSYSVGLLPKTQVVDEDAFDQTFSVAAGANIINTAVGVLESTGETRIAVTPSSAVLANPQAWDAGVPKLTIINELLEAAGYWSLWVDGGGQFRVEPYVDPADREPAYEFVQGSDSIHFPEWSRDQDLSSVPNRFVCVGQGDDETPPLVGVAENTDPDSPFSFQARGRWVTRTEEGVEAASQAVIDQLARRRLLDAMSPVEHVRARHALIPLNPNDAILFTDSGFSERLTVQNMTVPFTWDAVVDAEWRRTGA